MKAPKLPLNEAERLKAIKSYNILDTLPEADYDNITQLVASICDAPISLIAVLDDHRNFFKSHYGVPFNQSPRDISFCGYTILEDDILIIEDARQDERFIDNPLVSEENAIFYAGVPLINAEGYSIGTICVFDHKPRALSESQRIALKTMGKQVVNLLELRRNNFRLENAKKELEERNVQLKSFASHVSHDLKSPLSNIMSLVDLLRDENKHQLSEDSMGYINYIEESATILKKYIDGILRHYKTDELLEAKKETITLSDIAEDLKQLLFSKKTDQLIYSEAKIENINKSALSQILINLVDNALKYNDKAERIIELTYQEQKSHHRFIVKDNGIGIPEYKQDDIFEIFRTVKNDISKSSTGIGLSSVKNLVEKLNGKIEVSSKVGKGSTFSFNIEK